jgi:prepilin-type N-terminal cleavage/methylation domain-containing protein
MKSLTKCKDRQAGFTLVELAIVMIIIGLLIGGILKGQELVANARVTATVAQIKALDGAISTFSDKYNAVPGDMINPGARLPNCTGDCSATYAFGAVQGDGNIVDANAFTPGTGAYATGSEGFKSFLHLAAANLITGVNPDRVAAAGGNAVILGDSMLETEISNGGYRLGFSRQGNAAGIPVGSMRRGHYLMLTGSVTDALNGLNSLFMNPTQASQIDFKIDDGVPDAGSVQAPRTGAAATRCVVVAGGVNVYDEADVGGDGQGCSLYIQVQG